VLILYHDFEAHFTDNFVGSVSEAVKVTCTVMTSEGGLCYVGVENTLTHNGACGARHDELWV